MKNLSSAGALLKIFLLGFKMFLSLSIFYLSRHMSSPSSSPVPFSPTGALSNSSLSPTPPVAAASAATTAAAVAAAAALAYSSQKITGIPCIAAASKATAPVHIDVGGTIYTSSLDTLTK